MIFFEGPIEPPGGAGFTPKKIFLLLLYILMLCYTCCMQCNEYSSLTEVRPIARTNF